MKLKMKKGQIQFMETIFVLLILIIILFIGMIFVYVFLSKSIGEKKEDFSDVDTIIFTDSLIRMPELTCGDVTYCMDTLKIFGFKKEFENKAVKKSYYKSLFKNRKITVEIVYPKSSESKECIENMVNEGGYPSDKCDHFVIFTPDGAIGNAKIYRSPVQLYFPELEKNALGVIKIEVFEEK